MPDLIFIFWSVFFVTWCIVMGLMSFCATKMHRKEVAAAEKHCNKQETQ